MTSSESFNGSSVIVTGAGSGIGRSAALKFAAAGAGVVVCDIDAIRATTVVDEIKNSGGRATAVTGDIGDQAVVDEIVATAVDEFGGIDVLVNNAGIMDTMSAPHEITDDEWERVIRTNLTAPFRLTRAVAPHMLAKGKGAIVNITSEAGLRGSAAGSAYTTSKHGLIGLTESAAVMYRDKGIRVNAIAPGGTATNIRVDVDPTHAGPATIGAYMQNVGRIADPDELAAAIVFLASDAASDISGVVLPVDGGWSAV